MNVESLQIQKMYYSYLYYKKMTEYFKGHLLCPFLQDVILVLGVP